MRARRSAYERAGDGFALVAVAQPRPRASDEDGQAWLGVAGSIVAHAGIIAGILLLPHGAPPGEEQTAPAYAVEYEAAAPNTPTPPAASEPRVSLDDSDAPPPPPIEAPSADAVPLPPPRHYGAALHPRVNKNPFANITPFNLATTLRPSHPDGRPGSTFDLSAGPVVREGRLTPTVQHPRGSQVSGDYDAKLVAWVESHREDIQVMLKAANAGNVTLRVTIARDGHVLRIHLLRPSGSILLDAAWVSFYRDFVPPPLGADITGDEYTFDYTLEYSIIYGRPAPP